MAVSQAEGPLGGHLSFWRAFADGIAGGVPLLAALDRARGAAPGTDLDRAAAAVAEAMRGGEDFSRALEAHAGVFARSVRTMVRAGEAGGVLDVIAGRITEGIEEGSFPVPGAEGAKEPGDAATASTFRAFGRMLSSGVPVLEVLDILAEEAPTPGIADVWRSVRKAIMEGGTLAEALGRFPEFLAEKVVDAVRWGERAGRLDEAATRIADALVKGDLGPLPGTPPEGSVPGHKEKIGRLEDAAPVVKLVNLIILEGIKSGATDIHIEPYAKEVKVRYRIDGVCVEKLSPPKEHHNAVVTRIKIMADLDIAERRRPQDGKIRMKYADRSIDFRVAVMPTVYGETVVMRVLRPDAAVKALPEIVTAEGDLEKVRAACRLPSGLVLVTGVPGSGKSTLLYSMVHEIDRKARSVVSVEDPVEYVMEDVQQVQVNHKAGLTCATALRGAFRLDPDVIVIGDAGDIEVADLALRASATGRLVLWLLHAPTAVDAVMRLVEMDLPVYELNAAVAAVVSQRLVRKLCPKCRAEAGIPDGLPKHAAEYLRGLKDAALFSPVGCEECNGGFKGRVAIQEFLVPDEGFRRALSSGAGSEGLHKAALEGGMTTFLARGLELAAEGVTSVDEALRAARDPRWRAD